MKKMFFTSMFCFAFLITLVAQQKTVLITPNIGFGFGDGTSCTAWGGNIGYQFSNNRISLCFLTGSKKRTDYANGDFDDALIENYTLVYSRIIGKEKISIVPSIGLGYVSGNWTENSDGNGEHFQQGFGLAFGCGIEYSLTDHLFLKLSYDHALLITDFSGNGAFLGGIGLKF